MKKTKQLKNKLKNKKQNTKKNKKQNTKKNKKYKGVGGYDNDDNKPNCLIKAFYKMGRIFSDTIELIDENFFKPPSPQKLYIN
jgi:hypothetical protein